MFSLLKLIKPEGKLVLSPTINQTPSLTPFPSLEIPSIFTEQIVFSCHLPDFNWVVTVAMQFTALNNLFISLIWRAKHKILAMLASTLCVSCGSIFNDMVIIFSIDSYEMDSVLHFFHFNISKDCKALITNVINSDLSMLSTQHMFSPTDMLSCITAIFLHILTAG